LPRILILLGFSLLPASQLAAQDIELRYDDRSYSGQLHGASSNIFYGGQLRTSPTWTISKSILGENVISGATNTSPLRFNLTGFTKYSSLIRPGGTEIGPLVFFQNLPGVGNIIDAGQTQTQDPFNLSRFLNNIEITGSKETATTPRTRFGFIGTNDAVLNTAGEDIDILIESLVLTDVDLTKDISKSPWYQNPSACTTFGPGGSCNDGDISLGLGAGFTHTRAYIELNNAALKMGDQVYVNVKSPLELVVGPGDSILNMSATVNRAPSAGAFTMTGTPSDRAALSIRNTATPITDDPDQIQNGNRFLTLGSVGTLNFADLDIASSSVEAPSGSRWTVADSSITLTANQPTAVLKLKGDNDFTRTTVTASGETKFMFVGNIGTTKTTFTDTVVDFRNANNSIFQVQSDVVMNGDNTFLGATNGIETNRITFGGNSTVLQSGSFNIDGATLNTFRSNPGTIVRLVIPTKPHEFRSAEIGGTLTGSGLVDLRGSTIALNGVVSPEQVRYMGGNSFTTKPTGEFKFQAGNVNFGPSSVYDVDLTLDTKLPDGSLAFRKDTLRTTFGNLETMPRIDVSLGTEIGMLPTADEMDGLSLMVAEVLDLKPGLGIGAGIGFDPALTSVNLGPSFPALLEVAAVNDAAKNVADALPNLDRTANVSLEFTQLPATQLPNTALAPTNQSAQNSLGQVGVTSTVSGSNQLVNGTQIGTATNALTNSQVSQFGLVHAEPYSSHLSVGLEHQYMLGSIVMDHAVGAGEFSGGIGCGQNPTTPHSGKGQRGWVDARFGRGHIDGRSDLGNFDYNLRQVVGGIDLAGTCDRSIGFFLAAGRSSLDEHDQVDQDFETDTVSLGLYGHSILENGIQLTGTIGLGWGESTTTRRMPAKVGNFTGGTAEAEFDTRDAFLGVRLHRAAIPIVGSGWSYTPSLGLGYQYTRMNGLQESGGGDFNYKIESASAESFVVSPGIDATLRLGTERLPAALSAYARLEFDLLANSNDVHTITASTPTFGSFEQVGQNRGELGIRLGLQYEGQISENTFLGVSYDLSRAENATDHRVGANLTYRW